MASSIAETLKLKIEHDILMFKLKPGERLALGLLAAGYSYKEICAHTEWTYTKVNRLIGCC